MKLVYLIKKSLYCDKKGTKKHERKEKQKRKYQKRRGLTKKGMKKCDWKLNCKS